MKLESIWWLMMAITWMEIKETFSTAAKNNEILKHKFLPRNIGGKSKKKKSSYHFEVHQNLSLFGGVKMKAGKKQNNKAAIFTPQLPR